MRIFSLLAALLVLACTSPPPKTTRYLLPADVSEGTARIVPRVRVGLGRVSVPPYLSGSGLVIETEVGQVRPARQHLWAEPLDTGLRRFLRIEISSALGHDIGADPSQGSGWDTTIDVGIDRLHGNLEGEARLVARWRISPKEGPPADYRFSGSEPLPRPGYPGLVDAEVVLLRQLAHAIAASLSGSGGTPGGS